jgi:ABC-2 type transport system permease protein
MHPVLTLLRKDFAVLRRNRSALILSLVVPMVIIYVVGLVFGLGRKESGPSGIPLAVINQCDHPAARELVAALQAERAFRVVTEHAAVDGAPQPLTEAGVREMIHDRKLSYALILPPDLLSDTRFGLRLRILSDPRNEIESQMVNGLLQRAIFSHVPQLLGQSLQARARKFLGEARHSEFNTAIAGAVARAFGGDAARIKRDLDAGDLGLAEAATGAEGNAGGGDLLAQLVKVETEQVVGRDVKSPAATRIIGGYAVMFLLFALSHAAAGFFEEKNAGLFQRVLSAPVSRAQLLWSRFLYGVLFGLGQLMVLFLAGQALYGVDVTGQLGLLLPMAASVAAACTGFGMLVAAITRSAEAARSLATLLVITMSACGGAWFPVSFMPEFMQQAAKFTLVYWAMEGFGAVLWADAGLWQLLPIFGVLLGITAGVMGVAVWRFNRAPVFD